MSWAQGTSTLPAKDTGFSRVGGWHLPLNNQSKSLRLLSRRHESQEHSALALFGGEWALVRICSL